MNDIDFQFIVSKMLAEYCDNFAEKSCVGRICFADYTRDFYWKLVLVMVIGERAIDEALEDLISLYRDAWIACIAALGQPGAHMFSFYMSLPLPTVIKYKSLTSKLRARIKELIKCRDRPKWCILSVIENEMSEADQLEVAMEFLFTGASSVTTSLVWMIWHIALDKNLQQMIRVEAQEALKNSFDPVHADASNTFAENWLISDSMKSCSVLEAALKETLRMYPPIHIGRLSVEDFVVTNAIGEKVTIPRGTDIMSNMWFVHRDEKNWSDPNSFDYSRFIDKPHNVPNYHPFSMGVRACPGQRIAYNVLKLVAANMVLKYDIEPLVGAPDTKFAENLMLPVTPSNILLRLNKR